MQPHLLGVKVDYDLTAGTLKLSQVPTIDNLLERFGMTECSPAKTPAAEFRLTKRPITETTKETALEAAKLAAEWGSDWASLYRVVVGSLIWITVSTRPDISFAVIATARFVSDPTAAHFLALKRIMRYLRGTRTFGLLYKRDITTNCAAYSDAD